MTDQPLPSRTTAEEDLRTSSQRRINLIWEFTQGYIAIAVTTTTLIVSAALILKGSSDSTQLLSNAFFLVIGFYFGRTNHARIGDLDTRPK
jgi:hypothetical protein